ncbi:MAG: queuosine precursor transporter [Flavobacteriales bacterium]|nr:queuosine precursor transporter [Bacteroidota bacterium]MCB9240375.1 queuosine precursor transporter [Flavobacteriales bacterium]
MMSKKQRLFVILGAIFLSNALLAEFIGGKIFSVEHTLGLPLLNWTIFGFNLSMNMTAGVLLWPVVFILTDIINEYYGKKGVRFLSFLTAILISYSFIMIYGAIGLRPADFWITTRTHVGIPDMDVAFQQIFGQGMWIIAGSLVAFLIGQIADVTAFHWIRKITGARMLWLRATGSTLVSQFIDTFVVLIIAFKIGQGWPLKQVLAIGLVGYLYKFIVAIVLTPLLYLIHGIIDRYLGHEEAHQMMEEAARQAD